EEEHRMLEPNLRHAHILLQQPKEVNLKLPRPVLEMSMTQGGSMIYWRLRKASKGALRRFRLRY
ncbi:hypothetical protein KEJ34_09600, partial [Candidatus Bathyarchaeota archaeon]|nr:hypothetical protein [Candidatus Bathyarchaeota archaeon]